MFDGGSSARSSVFDSMAAKRSRATHVDARFEVAMKSMWTKHSCRWPNQIKLRPFAAHKSQSISSNRDQLAQKVKYSISGDLGASSASTVVQRHHATVPKTKFKAVTRSIRRVYGKFLQRKRWCNPNSKTNESDLPSLCFNEYRSTQQNFWIKLQPLQHFNVAANVVE